jgi:uncharacterized protein (UPF0147 family)
MADIQAAIDSLSLISEDLTVPKNIRKAAGEAKARLERSEQAEKVRINAAISILDDVSNDPNIPYHTRTQVWQVAGLLESN